MTTVPVQEAVTAAKTINTAVVSAFSGGTLFGGAVGFFFGYKHASRRIKDEVMKRVDAEVTELKEYYESKMVAAKEKPEVEEIIAERGYVTTYTAVEPVAGPSDVLRAPVPITKPRPVHATTPPADPVHFHPTEDTRKERDEGWLWAKEMSQRSTRDPHIIHQSEYEANESGFSQSSLTYYVEDRILVDEHNDPVEPEDVSGKAALRRFGHGSDDAAVVYVRNPVLQAEYEVTRIDRSYHGAVLGLGEDDAVDGT